MDTFLSPIEKPQGAMMKLAYYFTRRQFGKVLTSLKVHSARLPSAFGMFYGKVSQLDKQLVLPKELAMLVRTQVARINICLFCIDIGRWFSIRRRWTKLSSMRWTNMAPVPYSPWPSALCWTM